MYFGWSVEESRRTNNSRFVVIIECVKVCVGGESRREVEVAESDKSNSIVWNYSQKRLSVID